MIFNTAELIVLTIGLSASVFYCLKLNYNQSLKLSRLATFFLFSSYSQNLKLIFLITSRVFKFFSFLKNGRIIVEYKIKSCDDLLNFRSVLLWMNLCFNTIQPCEKINHNFDKKSITFRVTKDIKIPLKLHSGLSWQNGNFYPGSCFYTWISLA
jgi:hypothetical protein